MITNQEVLNLMYRSSNEIKMKILYLIAPVEDRRLMKKLGYQITANEIKKAAECKTISELEKLLNDKVD